MTICPVDNGEGGSWGPNDTILFASRRGPIRRVSAHGGTPSEVTRLADNAAIHNWPYFLPDGQSFVYFAGKIPGESAVRLRTLASGDDVELVNVTSRAVVAAGHLLWVRDGQLMAQPLDARRQMLTGEPRVIVGNVAFNPGGGGRAAFHASDSGVLVYRLGTTLEQGRLTWWSREGKQISIVDQGKSFGAVVLSPDGSRAVVQVNEAVEILSNADLWTYEFSTGVRTRFTTEPGVEWAPAWSPDGQSIAYSTSDARGQIASASVWIKPAGGAQPARKISDGGVVSTWLPDGGGLLVTRTNPKTGNDVWMIPLSGGSEQPLLQTSFDERDAEYSPDGRWLSYITNESGEFDIYVQPVPATGRKWRVTPDGGTSPQWSKDSRELFFSYRGHIHVATVSSSGVSTPTVVVRDAVETNPARGSARRFAVWPDAQRLLAVRSPIAPNDTPLTVILNWTELLRR